MRVSYILIFLHYTISITSKNYVRVRIINVHSVSVAHSGHFY